jgi:hypothetical protein
MSSLQHQIPTSSSNKRPRPDESTEESFKRLRVTSNKRERPQEEGAHSSEDALQSFKRLKVNETSSYEGEEHQIPHPHRSPSQHTNQQAGQDTSSMEVPNYNSMNRLLGQLHQERLRHAKHAESHLPSDSQLY